MPIAYGARIVAQHDGASLKYRGDEQTRALSASGASQRAGVQGLANIEFRPITCTLHCTSSCHLCRCCTVQIANYCGSRKCAISVYST